MNNFTTPRFWQQYNSLAPEIRKHADRCFALFQRDPQHPALQFQKKDRAWVARVGPGHRAAVVSIISDHPLAPSVYKQRLAKVPNLSHVTVEVETCPHLAEAG